MTAAARDPAPAAAFRIAVVGSGPSGFYATEALFRSGTPVAVDMFEQLPVPYGLVRFGVAPDHPKLKQVTVAFDRIATMPGFRFVGGVTVGRDVTIDELRASYDAVILATGADVSRALGIPGETLAGCHHAGDFVAWYNGHPDYRDCSFDLAHDAVTIVGHGNVALDVARILARTVDELRLTDIASHALEVLAESRVREIHLVGRSGPRQAKFGAKELRDFLALAQCDAVVDPRDVAAASVGETSNDPEMSEKLELLGAVSQRPVGKQRRCVFRFGLSPVAINGRGRVEEIAFADPSRSIEAIPCGVVFSSIGRRTAPLPGVPFDAQRGVHANVDGRVVDTHGVVPGLYVCGWSKRGPSGTIGTNRACGMATAEAVLTDLPARAGSRLRDPDILLAQLRGRVSRIVSFDDWSAIDAAEKSRGVAQGRPREKFVSVPEMMAVLASTP
ncbi:FAD-dependent pyridine nucleotide-disulphide oxidoreductase [Rhodopseudomonas palustris HaA2]|uniref:FAD-dependent pyridine nucleotide-disulphide oxidoreductase n=1 Tax=Rhodopseudomonas palustris (strain HaA2) TaxID=316058 RepID=Q2IUK0_RHOP2|nr:FAD-dependent oxidoreductase [Rhodopseudomonas palustris]ABD08110.1 FAD-dependent pyridine nucleotide-disulphide oxidoreductase [Rhodopseudomonas palustris HaA2]